MRLLSVITFLTLFAMAAFVTATAARAASMPSPHEIDIPSRNGVLHAQLYKPEGNGPFPSVIALI